MPNDRLERNELTDKLAEAIEQLEIWAERSGAGLIKHKENSDPAAVAYDSVEAAIARKADIVFIDTAGRLHTKINLMEELKKIRKVICKKLNRDVDEILIVLDSTTGQNAKFQIKVFKYSPYLNKNYLLLVLL